MGLKDDPFDLTDKDGHALDGAEVFHELLRQVARPRVCVRQVVDGVIEETNRWITGVPCQRHGRTGEMLSRAGKKGWALER